MATAVQNLPDGHVINGYIIDKLVGVGVIVKKAAMRARDEGELHLIIADEIEDQNDRKAFIKKAISASRKV